MSWGDEPYDWVADESRCAAQFAPPQPRHQQTEVTPSARDAARDDLDWQGGWYR